MGSHLLPAGVKIPPSTFDVKCSVFDFGFNSKHRTLNMSVPGDGPRPSLAGAGEGGRRPGEGNWGKTFLCGERRRVKAVIHQPLRHVLGGDALERAQARMHSCATRPLLRSRAWLKTPRRAVFGEKAVWRGATKKNTPRGSSTEEHRSQTAFCAKTLWAAGLLPLGGVGLVVTARCGDPPTAPPCPQPKSLAAARRAVFKQALKLGKCFSSRPAPAG